MGGGRFVGVHFSLTDSCGGCTGPRALCVCGSMILWPSDVWRTGRVLYGSMSPAVVKVAFCPQWEQTLIYGFDDHRWTGPEGRPGDFWCLRPVSGISGLSVWSHFFILYISSLVLLPGLVAFSVLSFAALGPFSWPAFHLNFHFPKGIRVFCVALVFFFCLSG